MALQPGFDLPFRQAIKPYRNCYKRGLSICRLDPGGPYPIGSRGTRVADSWYQGCKTAPQSRSEGTRSHDFAHDPIGPDKTGGRDPNWQFNTRWRLDGYRPARHY